MSRKKSTRKCPICQQTGMKRNGVTSSGKDPVTVARSAQHRVVVRGQVSVKKAVFTSFLDWLIGGNCHPQVSSSFYRTAVENTNKLVLAGQASYSYDRGNL